MPPFEPLFRNCHLQTILGAYWPRPFDPQRFPVSAHYHRTEPGVQVLVHSQLPSGTAKGTLLLVHGLEGSSGRGYMRSAAHAALSAGYAVHRMNIRTCGGTEELCDTLYHAGLTSDIRFLLECLSGTGPVFAAGYSLGANQVLKCAGELGASSSNLLAGVIGISAPLDLAACARALGHPRNRLYEHRFLVNITERLERRCRRRADLFRSYLDSARHSKTIWDFDDRVTARFFGFAGAAGYYGSQSCGLFLDSIRIPALLIHAQDDPMIPFEVYRNPAVERNPHLTLMAPEWGGHVGFLAKGDRRFWVDRVMVDWIEDQTNKSRNKRVPERVSGS